MNKWTMSQQSIESPSRTNMPGLNTQMPLLWRPTPFQDPTDVEEDPADLAKDIEFRRQFGQYWGMGWKTGFYGNADAKVSCPFLDATHRKWFNDGICSGFDAKEKLDDIPVDALEVQKMWHAYWKSQQWHAYWKPQMAEKKKKVVIFAGRLSSQVTNMAEIEKIWLAYKANGGRLSFNGIEKAFGLRPNNGKTAYRIIQKYKGLLGTHAA